MARARTKITPAYFKWRKGRPRWEPGPRLRAAGHKGRDLKDEAGNWLGLEAAIAAADAINAEVDVWRATGTRRLRPQVPLKSEYCCDALWQRYLASPSWANLKPKTQEDYHSKANVFLAAFGDYHVKAIRKPHLYAFWEQLHRERGHTMANGVMTVVSSLFSYAERIGWRDEETNPAKKMQRQRPPPRLVLYLPNELEALVLAADRIGFPEIGDATVIALHSGQRLSDVLAMPPRLFEEHRINLRQFKHGALIDAPMTDVLQTRISAIRVRWQRLGVLSRDTIVARADGREHTPRSFNSAWRNVRAAAAIEIASVADKNFQDLRDTAVTRLALADCSMAEISAITGHTMQSINQIMRHYLVLQPEMADSAIAKLQAWIAKEGIAI